MASCNVLKILKQKIDNIKSRKKLLIQYIKDGSFKSACISVFIANCDVNATDKNGWTALHHVVKKILAACDDCEILYISRHLDYLEHPPDPSLLNNGLLQEATQLIKRLIQNGANINIVDKAGHTPLSLLLINIPRNFQYLYSDDTNENVLSFYSHFQWTVKEIISLFLYYNADLTINQAIIRGLRIDDAEINDILEPYISCINIYERNFLKLCNARIFYELRPHMDCDKFFAWCCETFIEEQTIFTHMLLEWTKYSKYSPPLEKLDSFLEMLHYCIGDNTLRKLFVRLDTSKIVDELFRMGLDMMGIDGLFLSTHLNSSTFLTIIQMLLWIDNRLSVYFFLFFEIICASFKRKYIFRQLFEMLQDMNITIVKFLNRHLKPSIRSRRLYNNVIYIYDETLDLDLLHIIVDMKVPIVHKYIPNYIMLKMYFFYDKNDIFHEIINGKGDEQEYPDEILRYYSLPVNCPTALERINANRKDNKYHFFMPSLMELARNTVLKQFSLNRDVSKPFDVVRKIKELNCPKNVQQVLLLRQPLYNVPDFDPDLEMEHYF